VEDYCVQIDTPTNTKNILAEKAQMTLFPNPTQESFFIKLRSNEFLEAGQIEAVNLQGKVIWSQTQSRLPKGKIQLEVPSQNWLPGVYFIRFRNQEGAIVKKMIKSR